MADKDKNKKSLFTRIDEALAGGELLLNKEAEKLKNPDDPNVRILERKNQYIFGVPSRHRSWYLYEPYTRYKRKENPDYKRYKNYSLAGTLTGLGMLVTGFASEDYTLAYTGAALTLASVGYLSGHSLRQRTTDERFEKVPWPEEKD